MASTYKAFTIQAGRASLTTTSWANRFTNGLSPLCPAILREVPPANVKAGNALGRHLDGCRIGFDLGASDRKVSAVIDGQVIFSEEVIWEPRKHTDPAYHYSEIHGGVEDRRGQNAQRGCHWRKLGRDLYRQPPDGRLALPQHPTRALSTRSGTSSCASSDELKVPLEVINDGDVTALAGSMSLEDNGVLGIAMGSSEAAGYVDPNGHILGWLNELAFAPVDYSPDAPLDEWSGDLGCGSTIFLAAVLSSAWHPGPGSKSLPN